MSVYYFLKSNNEKLNKVVIKYSPRMLPFPLKSLAQAIPDFFPWNSSTKGQCFYGYNAILLYFKSIESKSFMD